MSLYEHLGDVSLTVPALQRLAIAAYEAAKAEPEGLVKTELYNFRNLLWAIIEKAVPDNKGATSAQVAPESWLDI